MTRAPGRPSLPIEQAEHVRALLVRVRDERYEANSTAIAKALGMTPSACSQIISRKNRPSFQTVQALAKLLHVDEAEILSGETLEAAPRSSVVDRYPERARALLRLRGLLPADVEERIRSIEVHDDRPLDELDWIELAVMRTREHTRIVALTARVKM